MTVTGWQVVGEKGKQPDNAEQLVRSATPACPARVSPQTNADRVNACSLSQIIRPSQAERVRGQRKLKRICKKLQVVRTSSLDVTLNNLKSTADETFFNLIRTCTATVQRSK